VSPGCIRYDRVVEDIGLAMAARREGAPGVV
jgi:hypothetical protein